MGGPGGVPKKKKEPDAEAPPTSSQQTPASVEAPPVQPSLGQPAQKVPPVLKTPQKPPSSLAGASSHGKRTKKSRKIVHYSHATMWQQLKILFFNKTAKESIEFWGGVVLRGEQKPHQATRPVEVHYYQAFGLPNVQ